MKILLSIFFWAWLTSVFTQVTTNLYPNGDFEGVPTGNFTIINTNNFSGDPCRIDQENIAYNGNQFLSATIAYYIMDNGYLITGDKLAAKDQIKFLYFFNVGLSLSQSTVPNCEYAISYATKTLFNNYNNVNCIQSSLNGTNYTNTLIIDSINSRFSNQTNLNDLIYYIDLSDTSFYSIGGSVISQSQTVNDINTPTYTFDSLNNNWQLINYTYLEQNSNDFFVIGYFKGFTYLMLDLFYSFYSNPNGPWMIPDNGVFSILIDDLSIFPIGYENLTLSLKDTSLCLSSNLFIDAFNPQFTNYIWSNGDTTSNTIINSPGKYWLTAYYPYGYLSDTFFVADGVVDLLPSSYSDTITICPLQFPISLSASDTFTNYLWSNGDTSFSSTFHQEGMVYLQSEHFCGTLVDSVFLKEKPFENIDLISFEDTLICENQLPLLL